MRRRFTMASLLLVGTLAIEGMSALSCCADEPDDAKRIAEVAAEARRFAEKCYFTAGARVPRELQRQPEPILRWSNPTAGKVFGDVYLWTDSGRPAVVATVYRFYSPFKGATLEIASLSEDGATGAVDGLTFWKTRQPGTTLGPLADSEAPARNPSVRLVQMRRLAASFQATLTDSRAGGENVPRELRLLPQPVYRYPAAEHDVPVLDGALFVFVEGTDPEALLLLEARGGDQDTKWHFGLSRLNRDELVVSRAGQQVWSAPYISDILHRSTSAYSVYSLEEPLKTIDRSVPTP